MMDTDLQYINGRGATFEQELSHIFSVYKQEKLPLRLVFFGNAAGNQEYMEHLEMITRAVNGYFGDETPVFSYVAQPPLEGCRLVMEVAGMVPGNGSQVFYKRSGEIPYIVIESAEARRLLLGGVRDNNPLHGTGEQSDRIFSAIGSILKAESMPVSSIIRQWNYIEKIVKTAGGQQNYQDFNDSRSRFYNGAAWVNGYPAATGVGTSCGGVMIDLEAFCPVADGTEILPLNNSLQVAAHAYSPVVLIGREDEKTGKKTTPKFERAKLVHNGNRGLVYISGTAAIRGELSLVDVGVGEQTRITLENIEHLISDKTLGDAGIEGVEDATIFSMRVYLKEESFLDRAREIIGEKYSGTPAVYLKADVCRDELLVEIEGFASILITPIY